MNRSSQQGFTLIELVAVIVLLGILAVTALPRFLNVQTDARISVINGVLGSMQGAAQQTYAKALIQGKTGSTRTSVTSTAGNISVINGFPSAHSPGAGALDIETLVSISGTTSGGASDIKFSALSAGTTRLVGYDTNSDGVIDTTDKCYATYSETLTKDFPTISTTDLTGC
jgi:MSHA pilin protein MshA